MASMADVGFAGAREQRGVSALLLLADGRFPAGGHAHSGGLEAAVALEGVDTITRLEAFLRGRAATTGAVSAAFAAAACAALTGPPASGGAGSGAGVLTALDRELDARIPSPALRAVSRRLGRQLLRAGRVVWPDPRLDELAAAIPGGPHQPLVLGVVAAVAGLSPAAAAAAAVHETVASPATAAVRLLGLDPFAVHAALARIGAELDAIAAEGAAHAHTPPADLPAWGAPLLDVLAELHATWEVRLFGS
jgi:urease accessory protein